jgi:hypothetical protein
VWAGRWGCTLRTRCAWTRPFLLIGKSIYFEQ